MTLTSFSGCTSFRFLFNNSVKCPCNVIHDSVTLIFTFLIIIIIINPCRVVNTWNSLPEDVVTASSMNYLKGRLDNLFGNKKYVKSGKKKNGFVSGMIATPPKMNERSTGCFLPYGLQLMMM